VIALRDATIDDAQRVYAWNCAPDVRAASGDQRPVAYADHLRWYQRRVQAGEFWIVEEDGEPVGVVRIDRDAISISLAPEARGRGIGQLAIAAACARRGEPIVATVRTTNAASRACFEACGFSTVALRDAFVFYRWSPS
jgi:RimJ/RimL family protein N-acetyltransferase